MGRVIFAEILDRRGELRSRVRIDRFPFTIGRSYASDLILDDSYVCPEHARLVLRDDQVLVEDLGSVNGLYDQSSGLREKSLRVDEGAEIRLGREVIRFRAPEQPVEPALVETRRGGALTWLTTHWAAGLLMLAVVFASSALRDYSSTVVEISPARLISGAALPILLAAAWAGAWALLGRLLGRRPRFVAHWMTICAASLAGLMLEWGLQYARFLLSPIEPLLNAQVAANLVLVGLTLWVHLTVVGLLRPARRIWAAVAVPICVLGAVELANYADRPEWTTQLPYWSRLKAVPPDWLPLQTVDGFFGRVRLLEAEVDELATDED